jgi:hypothetical protein
VIILLKIKVSSSVLSVVSSGNHDLQSIYLDSFLKIAYINDSNLEAVFSKLEKISEAFHVDFIISISLNEDQLPENFKKNVIVSL